MLSSCFGHLFESALIGLPGSTRLQHMVCARGGAMPDVCQQFLSWLM